jgi:hypothetical protein
MDLASERRRASVRREPTAEPPYRSSSLGRAGSGLTEGGAGDWRMKTSSSRTDSWIRTPISWSANLVHWVGVSWMPSLRIPKVVVAERQRAGSHRRASWGTDLSATALARPGCELPE